MSADNRIIYYQSPKDLKYRVWEGSASVYYFEPPANAKVFKDLQSAIRYCCDLEEKIGFVEYGVQELCNEEIIIGLQEELRYVKYHYKAEKCKKLEELVDGCFEIIEIWKAESPAQIKWKKDWLKKAKELIIRL